MDSLKSTDLSHFKVKYRKIYLRTVICIYYILDGKFISDASLDFSSDIKWVILFALKSLKKHKQIFSPRIQPSFYMKKNTATPC